MGARILIVLVLKVSGKPRRRTGLARGTPFGTMSRNRAAQPCVRRFSRHKQPPGPLDPLFSSVLRVGRRDSLESNLAPLAPESWGYRNRAERVSEKNSSRKPGEQSVATIRPVPYRYAGRMQTSLLELRLWEAR